MKKKTLLVLLVLLLAFTQCARVQQYDPETDFRATPVEGGKSVEITSYVGGKQTVTIPSSVTSIGGYAFNGWTSSQTINIQGHANWLSADVAWQEYWRSGCGARINYGG